MIRYLSLGLVLGMVASASAERVLHVAANAAPGGDGSEARPFATLVQARDAIRALRKADADASREAITILIAPGVYPLSATWELTPIDSGSAEAPVIYRARQPGRVRLQGGVSLDPAAFQPVTDEQVLARLDPAVRAKVRVCDVSALAPEKWPSWPDAFRGSPPDPWLYVNGQPMTLARWPNEREQGDWAEFSKAVDTGLPNPQADDPALRKLHPGSFVFDDARPARWNIAEGVWLLGYWTHDWSDEVIRIGAYDEEQKVIKLAAPHHYGINAGTWGAAKRRFFAMNVLEELDAPGEWYLDRARKQLYLYPDGDLAASEIVLATLSAPLVQVRGAQHVQFVGLNFEFGHDEGVVLRNARHVTLAGCVVANLGGSGISIHGEQNTVRSCDLFNLGRAGILLNGGDRASLTPANNVAENNHIHHFGRFQRTYAPGVGLGGCGQVVRNNCIHDAPHNTVLYGGNEHRIERNEVYRVVLETGDAGAFYTGRDWTSQGNLLRHNYVHDLGGGDAGHVNTMGIYLDDCDCGDTLEGNVFYRAGRALMIGGGRDNPVLNNLVVDCPIGLHIDARGMTWSQWNNPADPSWRLEAKAQRLNYTQPPWSERYPRLAAIMQEDPQQPLGNVIRRNVFLNCTKRVCDFDGNVKKLLHKLDIQDNLAATTQSAGDNPAGKAPYDGFRNLAGVEDELAKVFADGVSAAESQRLNVWLQKEVAEFEPIPFDQIGLYVDEHRTRLPAR